MLFSAGKSVRSAGGGGEAVFSVGVCAQRRIKKRKPCPASSSRTASILIDSKSRAGRPHSSTRPYWGSGYRVAAGGGGIRPAPMGHPCMVCNRPPRPCRASHRAKFNVIDNVVVFALIQRTRALQGRHGGMKLAAIAKIAVCRRSMYRRTCLAHQKHHPHIAASKAGHRAGYPYPGASSGEATRSDNKPPYNRTVREALVFF